MKEYKIEILKELELISNERKEEIENADSLGLEFIKEELKKRKYSLK